MGQKSVQKLFSECAKFKDVEHVSVGKMTMKFASLFSETMGIESVDVLEFGHCADETKERVSQAIGSFKDNAFETMVNVNENGNRTKVLLRIKGDIIHELVILSSGVSPAMVRIKGEIKRSDIERIIKENDK
jgi:hypothetical protein